MKAIIFAIPGRPVPAARPRITKNGAHYPRRYRDWLNTAKVYAQQAWLGKEPLEGPVTVHVWAYGARPNADIDNILKAALDCITGSIIRDDKQVDMSFVARGQSENPRCEIQVTVLSGAGTTQ